MDTAHWLHSRFPLSRRGFDSGKWRFPKITIKLLFPVQQSLRDTNGPGKSRLRHRVRRSSTRKTFRGVGKWDGHSGRQGDDQPVVDRPDVQARPRRRRRLQGQEGRSSQDQQDRADSRFLIGLTLCSSIDGKAKTCLRPSAKDQGIAQVVLVFLLIPETSS